MSNVKSSFESTIKTFISEYSGQLSTWLKENKQVEVSAEDICSAFECQCTLKTSMGGTMGSSGTISNPMPNFFNQSESPVGRKTSTRKKNADPNSAKCVYVFSRGVKSGQMCGKYVAGNQEKGGDKYCKDCLKKTTIIAELTNGNSNTLETPHLPGTEVNVSDSVEKKSVQLSCLPIDDEPGLYRECNHNFVIKQIDDGYTVMFVQDGSTRRPLTSSEETIARDLGLNIQKSVQSTPSVSTAVSLPQKKSTFSIPNIK